MSHSRDDACQPRTPGQIRRAAGCRLCCNRHAHDLPSYLDQSVGLIASMRTTGRVVSYGRCASAADELADLGSSYGGAAVVFWCCMSVICRLSVNLAGPTAPEVIARCV